MTAAAATPQLVRWNSQSTQPAPAATSVSIEQEWYLRQRNQVTIGNRVPHAAVGVYLAPSAVVIGDVDLWDRVSVWNNVVIRGDLNNITINALSNIQDRTVIHAARTSPTGLPAATVLGKYVTVEPGCVLRSCRVGDYCLVGARSVLCEGSMMEEGSILGPGSVLPPARRIPAGEMWAGAPARFVRKLHGDEKDELQKMAEEVSKLAWDVSSEVLPYGGAWRKVEELREKLVKAGEGEVVYMRGIKYELRKEQEAEERAQQL